MTVLAAPGQNPRENPRHRERGPARRFTWADVAAVLGLQQRTAQLLATRGKFNPRDLRSIWTYALERSGLPRALRQIAALPCERDGKGRRCSRRMPLCPSCIAGAALERAGLTSVPSTTPPRSPT